MKPLFFGPLSGIQSSEVFVPFRNLFMPPSHAILAPDLGCFEQFRLNPEKLFTNS